MDITKEFIEIAPYKKELERLVWLNRGGNAVNCDTFHCKCCIFNRINSRSENPNCGTAVAIKYGFNSFSVGFINFVLDRIKPEEVMFEL